jgi:hypothetical protein
MTVISMKKIRTICLLMMFVAGVGMTPDSALPAEQAGKVPDLSMWVGHWFKLTMKRSAYHFSNYGVKPTPSARLWRTDGTGYLWVTDWDG